MSQAQINGTLPVEGRPGSVFAKAAVPGPTGTAWGPGSSSSTGQLFQLLRDGRSRTRAELARTTGLARSTVASRIEDLLRLGLIKDGGEAASSGGRPPATVAFDPTARAVLVIEAEASQILVTATDLAGRVLAGQRRLRGQAQGPADTLRRAITAGRQLLEAAGYGAEALAGVGIGLSSHGHGTDNPVWAQLRLAWHGFDFHGFVQQLLHVPVVVDSTVNHMAQGEHAAHWSGHGNFLFVNVDSTIGSAIISGGKLQSGANGATGGLGHVRASNGGDVACPCGNHGCLDTISSVPALVRKVRQQGVDALTGADLLCLADAGQPQVISALHQGGCEIGDTLATVVSLLNPSVIVLGGTLGESTDVLAGVREAVYRRALPPVTSQLQICQSLLHQNAAVAGATRVVAERILSPAAIDAALRDRSS